MSENKKTEVLADETKKLLEQYFDAASHLYGIVPLRTVLRIYNSQNEPVSEDAFINFVENLNLDKKYYDIFSSDEIYGNPNDVKTINKDIVAEYLCFDDDFEEYFEILEFQFGKPYYIPDKKQFLKYSDDLYFEKTLEYITLRAFLRNLPYLTKERADNIAEEIELFISMEKGDIEPALSRASQMGVDLKNSYTKNELINLCEDLYHNTRMHIYCGHTMNEMGL